MRLCSHAAQTAGTFKIVMEVFIGPLENARFEKYNYTLVVKKKDE